MAGYLASTSVKAALLLVAGLSLSSLAFAVPSSALPLTVEQAQADPVGSFRSWVRHFEKAYRHDVEEYERRFSHWVQNLEHIARHDHRKSRMQLGLNGLADMSAEEFRAAYLGQRHRQPAGLRATSAATYRYENAPIPKSVDWDEKGVVGPIKNQHVNGSACGCCWAFATIGIVECINAMYTGEVTALSEQQLVDCDRAGPWYDEGCEGGDVVGGMEYIIRNGGIDTEDDYPYIAGEDKKCYRRKENHRVVTIDSVEQITPDNETALMQAVAQHPVVVGVCCGDFIDDWHAYTGGIMDFACCAEPIDHAVVVVGYGTTEDGQDYWKLKNSWGKEWGEEGFFKLKRGLGGHGHCSIASMPSYPVKTSPNPQPTQWSFLSGLVQRFMATQ